MKTKYNQQSETIILLPEIMPDWEEFNQFAHELIATLAIKELNTEEIGADRHRITFTFRQNRFSLNYENYSNSIWIEADEPNAINDLNKLIPLLDTIDETLF